jgi:hypothetical protein
MSEQSKLGHYRLADKAVRYFAEQESNRQARTLRAYYRQDTFTGLPEGHLKDDVSCIQVRFNVE